MSDEMIKINVEGIMDEIRNNIKIHGSYEKKINFQDIVNHINDNNYYDFNFQEMETNISEANQYCNIQINHNINSGGVKGRIVYFVKKVIRKLIQFYIAPIVDEQREFNISSARSLMQVYNFIQNQQNNTEIIDNLSYEFNKVVKKDVTGIENISNKLREENILLKNKINEIEKLQIQLKENYDIISKKLELSLLKCDKLELMLEKQKEK